MEFQMIFKKKNDLNVAIKNRKEVWTNVPKITSKRDVANVELTKHLS